MSDQRHHPTELFYWPKRYQINQIRFGPATKEGTKERVWPPTPYRALNPMGHNPLSTPIFSLPSPPPNGILNQFPLSFYVPLPKTVRNGHEYPFHQIPGEEQNRPTQNNIALTNQNADMALTNDTPLDLTTYLPLTIIHKDASKDL